MILNVTQQQIYQHFSTQITKTLEEHREKRLLIYGALICFLLVVCIALVMIRVWRKSTATAPAVFVLMLAASIGNVVVSFVVLFGALGHAKPEEKQAILSAGIGEIMAWLPAWCVLVVLAGVYFVIDRVQISRRRTASQLLPVIDGSVCAVHGDQPAVLTCARCGSFACAACISPGDVNCAACQARVGPTS